MSNYKKKGIGRTIAGILCGVLSVAAVAGAGTALYMGAKNNGWFDSDETEQTEEASGGGATLSDGESNGISLTRTIAEARTLAANGQTAESTHVLTATVSPGYATNPELTWSIAWDTTHDGYSGNDWATDSDGDDCSANGVSVTDYVSLSATSGSSITVSCWQPFGCAVIITCAATDGSGVSATCNVDYQAYVESFSVIPSSGVLGTMSSSSSSTGYIAYSVTTSAGSIAADYTVTYSIETGLDEINTYIREYGTYYKNKNILMYESEIASGTINNTPRQNVFSYSLNWTTFFKSLIDTDSYTYSESMLADIYTALNALGYTSSTGSGVAMYHYDFTVVDNAKSDHGAGATGYLYLSSLSGYPTYAVTNVSLNTNSITF